MCQVEKSKIAKTIFPLAHLEKPEIRQIAAELNLESVATKRIVRVFVSLEKETLDNSYQTIFLVKMEILWM